MIGSPSPVVSGHPYLFICQMLDSYRNPGEFQPSDSMGMIVKAIMVIFMVAFAYLGGTAQAAELFQHNGSLMIVDYDSGTISYEDVKPAIRKTVSQGAIVFSGRIERRKFAQGTAYTFRRGCPSAPYEVSGRYDAQLPGFVLFGAAPHRPKSGCEILSYEIDNPNARLVFVDQAARDQKLTSPTGENSGVVGFEDRPDQQTSRTRTAPKPLLPTSTP